MCRGVRKLQEKMSCLHVLEWSTDEVSEWLERKGYREYVYLLCDEHHINGKALLLLTEQDLRSPPLNIQVLGDIKRLALDIRQLKLENRQALMDHGYDPTTLLYVSNSFNYLQQSPQGYHHKSEFDQYQSYRQCSTETVPSDVEHHLLHHHHHQQSNASSEDGHATTLRPEICKALIALTYLFVVTWITAFVMVIVHDRVPDMKKYPPLPDIFLDNVPHIPWAFHMCEWTGTLLMVIWVCVLLFHKHRLILLRRFFALSGTVFLLRCITMLITSLSVPGTHLECNPRPSNSEAPLLDLFSKMKQAYVIWKGAGMSIQGVRTCGDYMFSGHTVALTMLNFFITEYTPRDIYLLHTFTWMLNMFGIFFILSGHEHYSIDVFIAFYITSRLFLYYHTLANNQSLMQRDTGRTRIWFPLFSFFEADVDGIVPNEYESPFVMVKQLFKLAKHTYSRLSVLLESLVSHEAMQPAINQTSSSTRRNKRKAQ